MSIRRILLGLPLLLIALVAGGWYWLLYSESGARWIWSQAETATEGALSADAISGGITPGARIEGLTYVGNGIVVSADVVSIQVHVDLFPVAIEIGPALASGGRIEITEGDDTNPETDDGELELPVPVSVSLFEITDLVILGLPEDQDLVVDSASLSGTLESYLLSVAATWTSPNTGAVQGFADGVGDLQSFVANRLEVRSIAGTIEGSGTVSWEDQLLLDGDLGWQELHWPSAADPEVISQGGRVTADWSSQGWSLVGDIDIGTPKFPSGDLVIDASGDDDRVEIEIKEGQILGGTVSGQAEVSWRDERPLSIDLIVADIDVATLEDRLPALVNGKVGLHGQLEPLQLSATLTDINGDIFGATLLANGTVDISDNDIAVNDLRIEHGESHLSLDGWISDPDGLRLDLVIQEVSDYLDEASGPFNASGAVSLNDKQPFLNLDATSTELTYAGLVFDNIVIKALFNDQTHSVDLQLEHRGIEVQSLASGRLDSWREPTRWSGQLERLFIDAEEIDLATSSPASLDVAMDKVDLAGLCLSDNADVHLCTNMSWSAVGGFELAATLDELPVNLVNRFVETRLEFDQAITGQLDWRMTADGSSGDAKITMSAGTISDTASPDMKIVTEPGELTFRIEDDDIRAGVLSLPMTGFGAIAGEFSVEDVADQETSEVEGKLRVNVVDIGLFAAFAPAIDHASGKLDAEVSLSGSLDEPEYVGDMTLQNGRLAYLPIGLRLDDINLNSHVYENGELELSGEMRVGEGMATIRTRTDFLQTFAKGLELQLSGDNLTIIDVPDLKAIANTTLDLAYDGETLSIDGHLDVPTALIRPTSLGATRVSESEDVIIVAGELPGGIEVDSPKSDLRIIGELTVNVGDDVTIDIGLAQAEVAGSVVLTWSGDVVPMARGQYRVEGDVLAFGQKLEIAEGRIRFPGTRADEPLIRLVAVREIYGNSEVRVAGVLIDGELARPTVEAFTRPVTTEERALTLLVTGSDFNYEQGVGAVGFGTYIAPRIYASYGIGLFDQENIVRLRYDLKRGFGVTATSGQQDSGIDLSYRFEN